MLQILDRYTEQDEVEKYVVDRSLIFISIRTLDTFSEIFYDSSLKLFSFCKSYMYFEYNLFLKCSDGKQNPAAMFP